MSLLPLQLFKNLADETRLGIVLLLKARGELCVCDLCTALAQSQPKISRHLAMLRESGLLLDRKQGKWVHYRLSPQMPAWAAQVIEQAWLSQQEDVRLMISRLAGGAGCREKIYLNIYDFSNVIGGGTMLLAGTIFILTLVLVIWQPRGLGIAWSAAFGAALALATGGVQVADIPVVWHIVWNATATFIAVIIISLLLDESGFFEWAALHVSRWGRGRGRLLFTWIILLGAAVAALFANDGAALILTPIVIAMLRALGFSKGTMLAFVMAAGFIADTASLPLVVSNLVNIVSADFFAIGFREYASVMVPVDLAAILTTLAMLHLFFRKDIPPAWDMALLKAPATAIKDPATFRTGWGVLLLLLAGFFILEPLGIPVSAIAALGAGILFAVAKHGRVINTGKVLRGAPWQIVIFSLGMYLVVYGLRNAGLTDYLTTVLNMLAERGLWAATLGTGILSAFLSSIMNNMPSVLVGALSIDGSAATGTIKEAMIYANVIGCDLGPKITPIGSLATLLWLHVLAQKHITIGWGYYFRCGITMTLPVLLVTLAALALRLSFNQP